MTVIVDTTAGTKVVEEAVKAKVIPEDGDGPARLCLYEESDDLINHPIKVFNYDYVISHKVEQ